MRKTLCYRTRMYRNARRVPLKSKLALDGETIGDSRDLSRAGAFVETQQRPQIGTQHQVSLKYRGTTFRCQARVVRHASDGIGLEFDVPGADDSDRAPHDEALDRLLGSQAQQDDDLRWL